MRARSDVGKPEVHERARHLQRVVQRLRAIIHSEEQVAVQVDETLTHPRAQAPSKAARLRRLPGACPARGTPRPATCPGPPNGSAVNRTGTAGSEVSRRWVS